MLVANCSAFAKARSFLLLPLVIFFSHFSSSGSQRSICRVDLQSESSSHLAEPVECRVHSRATERITVSIEILLQRLNPEHM